jgi:cobalt/nickel transport system permease protein
MLPIHLAIGLVEGLATAAVLTFVWKARPELLASSVTARPQGHSKMTGVLTGFALAAAFTGGMLSWFASSSPDGLEWAIARTTGQEELAAPSQGIHPILSALQEKTAFLPGYAFRSSELAPTAREQQPAAWPAVDQATTTSGLAGGALTLLLTIGIGVAFRKRGPA